MGSVKQKLVEIEAEQGSGVKIFNRVVDWITNERMQLINITDRINEIVRKSGIRDGIVHLQSLHTTTAVFINEWQDALLHDVKNFLDDLVHRENPWRHNDPEYSDCERKNADSHLRGMIMGQSLCLQVRNSVVLLGTWQSIILAEFDGPRSRCNRSCSVFWSQAVWSWTGSPCSPSATTASRFPSNCSRPSRTFRISAASSRIWKLGSSTSPRCSAGAKCISAGNSASRRSPGGTE